MKPKDGMLDGGTRERYRLQLRQATAESPQRPPWDRSGAARRFVLRGAILERLGAHAVRESDAKH